MSRRANGVMLAGTGPTPERRLLVAHDVKADEKRVGPAPAGTGAVAVALDHGQEEIDVCPCPTSRSTPRTPHRPLT